MDANIETKTAPHRGPGRQKGCTKPPNSGRRKGSINKNSAEMRALFQMDGTRARRAVRKIAFNELIDPKVRLRALVEILDRAWGRVTAGAIVGANGAPLLPLGAPRDTAEELIIAQRIAYILISAKPVAPS